MLALRVILFQRLLCVEFNIAVVSFDINLFIICLSRRHFTMDYVEILKRYSNNEYTNSGCSRVCVCVCVCVFIYMTVENQ